MDRQRLGSRIPGSSLAAFATVFLVYALGAWIPLPGLDAEKLAAVTAFPSNPLIARLSIFSLGLVPLLTVLAHAEIAKLVFPRLARWQGASILNADRWNDILRISALVLAALQGYGIMAGLRAMELTDKAGMASVPVGIVTFIGSTALLIWLIDRLSLPGLGNGFWFLCVAPLVGALPAAILQRIDLVGTGGMAPTAGLFGLAFASAAILLAVTATSIVAQECKTGHSPETERDPKPGTQAALAAAIWPPFLAGIAAGYLVLPYSIAVSVLEGGASNTVAAGHIIVTALLVPIFSCLYAWRGSDTVDTDPTLQDEARRKRLYRYGLAGGLQSAICAGIGTLAWTYPVFNPWSGVQVIAVVTVMMSLASCWRSRSGSVPPGAVAPVALHGTGSTRP
ncbi:hypothetical protein FZC33_23735 [Labrys sp. KNU-23]|nr:hypothetical protein FZC33_23735 [Labrys sp. KNU-23]